MFVASNFILAAAQLLDRSLWAYLWVVFIAVAMTFFSPDPFNPVVRFFRAATEPVFRLVRRRLPVEVGSFDLSPLVVIALAWFIRAFLVRTLAELASRLR